MSDSRLLHSVDREIQIEVLPEVLAEVVLRTSPDANRTEIDDALRDNVNRQIEFVTPEGHCAIDTILSDD